MSDILDSVEAEDFEIRDSAYRHGISEADVRHALRNPLAARWSNHDMYLLIGAAQDGKVLEIGFGTTGAIVPRHESSCQILALNTGKESTPWKH